MRGRAFIVTLCACAGLLIPASAGADVVSAGGFKYVTKFKDVDEGSSQLVAKCPKGTHVLAGGYETAGDFGDVLLVVDFPIDDGSDPDQTPDNGWVIGVVNTSGGPLATFAEATCAKAKPKYRFDSFPVAANDQQGTVAECRGKEIATDLSVLDANAVLNSAFPTEAGAFSAYVDNHSDHAVSVDTIAVCLKAKVKLINQPLDIAGQAHGANTAGCPRHWFAVSGGQGNGGGFGQIAQTTASTLTTHDFSIGLDNLSTGTIGVNIVALCMKPLG